MLPYLFLHLYMLVGPLSTHLQSLTSADVTRGEKRGTHRSRTSPLPGSPLGPEAAFSITAATTLAASMLPVDGTSPLWRNVSGRERWGGEGREGWKKGGRDELKPPPDVKPTGGCGERHSRLRPSETRHYQGLHHPGVMLGIHAIIFIYHLPRQHPNSQEIKPNSYICGC